MSWEEYSLDQLGFVSRGKSKHRPRDAEHLYGGQYPFIQTGDVKHAGLYLTQHKQTYSDAGLAQSKLWPAGTLCITIAANIADTSILGFDACFPDSVIGFVPDENKADARFVKYMFDAKLKLQYRQFTQGAAQDNLSQKKLLSLKFRMPKVDVQREIVGVVATYDELIENNRRRIQLLEESARLLYREWFVHLRFPGHEHVKVVDGVPEGWGYMPLPDAVEINPRTPVEKNKAISYVPMSSLSETGMTVDISDFEVREKHTNVKFIKNDILLARITPCLENGKTALVYFLDEDEIACGSTEFIVLREKLLSPEYIYCLSRSYEFREHAIKSMTGSSGRQRVQVSAFSDYYVYVPPKGLRVQFNEFTKNCFGQIKLLTRQNTQLANARELLLPRLMNGDIAV